MKTSEFTVVSQSLVQLAMRERLDMVRAFMADLDDAGWRHCFDSEKDAWSFLGPLYKDKALRANLPPKVHSYLSGLAEAAE
jgi:hypothetical protein